MSHPITICGLGPGDESFITAETVEHIENAPTVIFRTVHHDAAKLFGPVDSFDHIYDSGNHYEVIYEEMVSQLISLSLAGPVTFVTPGSPLVLEAAANKLLADPNIETTTLPAMSFLDLAWDRLRIDPLAIGVSLVDGHQFEPHTAFTAGPMLIAQVNNVDVAANIAHSYSVVDDVPVTVLRRLGARDEELLETTWSQLDRLGIYDEQTTLFAPRLPQATGSDLVALTGLFHRLRNECPWDRDQTHHSLVKHLESETSEVIEAIGNLSAESPESYAHLEEELGDLLLQIFLHSEIAQEQGHFTIYDVARTLLDKMVRRHPHVFGDASIASIADAEHQWEQIKKKERSRLD